MAKLEEHCICEEVLLIKKIKNGCRSLAPTSAF